MPFKFMRAPWLECVGVAMLFVGTLTAAATAIPQHFALAQTGIDVTSLIDNAAAGDITALEAALPKIHSKADAALLRARIAVGRLRHEEAQNALAIFFASGDVAPAHLAIGWSTKAEISFVNGDYGEAVGALKKLLPLLSAAGKGDDAKEAAQTLAVATLLAKEPRQFVAGGKPGTIPTVRDKAGLIRVGTSLNDIQQDAVLDTGANLSVVTDSAAKRLGLRLLEGAASVGGVGGANVKTKLAIADRLTIAGIELRNVVFLVLDDAELEFPLPGGYQIDTVIGLPVFRALGRIVFDRGGSFVVGGPPLQGRASNDNLRFSGNDLFVVSRVNSVDTVLHLDSGASVTALSSRFAHLHPALVGRLARASRRIAGAGGVTMQSVALWRPTIVKISGQSIMLPEVQIVLGDETLEHEPKLGTLGQDVLGAFDAYAIDFQTMRFELGRRRGSTAAS